jgi:hypothetical protein
MADKVLGSPRRNLTDYYRERAELGVAALGG